MQRKINLSLSIYTDDQVDNSSEMIKIVFLWI